MPGDDFWQAGVFGHRGATGGGPFPHGSNPTKTSRELEEIVGILRTDWEKKTNSSDTGALRPGKGENDLFGGFILVNLPRMTCFNKLNISSRQFWGDDPS